MIDINDCYLANLTPNELYLVPTSVRRITGKLQTYKGYGSQTPYTVPDLAGAGLAFYRLQDQDVQVLDSMGAVQAVKNPNGKDVYLAIGPYYPIDADTVAAFPHEYLTQDYGGRCLFDELTYLAYPRLISRITDRLQTVQMPAQDTALFQGRTYHVSNHARIREARYGVDPRCVERVSSKGIVASTKFLLTNTRVEVIDPQTLEFKFVNLIRWAGWDTTSSAHLTAAQKIMTDYWRLAKQGVLNTPARASTPSAAPAPRPVKTVDPKKFCRYTDDLYRELGNGLADLQQQDQTVKFKTSAVTNEIFGRIARRATIQSTKEFQDLGRIESEHKNLQKILAPKLVEIQVIKNSIASTDCGIRDYQYQIDQWLQKLEQDRVTLTAVETQTKAAQDGAAQIATQIETLKERLQQIKLSTPVPAQDWIANLEEAGIRILDIKFAGYSAQQYTNVVEDLLAGMTQINFITTKPMIVHVDKDRTPDNQVVAGPFEVQLSCPKGDGNVDIKIRPAASWSIVGIGKKSASQYAIMWAPHTEPILVDPNAVPEDLFQTWRTGCRGEIIATLGYAFHSCDPRQAIFAALAWLSHANSEDQWGAQYKFFPRPDQLKQSLTAEPVLEPEVTVVPVPRITITIPEAAAEVLSQL